MITCYTAVNQNINGIDLQRYAFLQFWVQNQRRNKKWLPVILMQQLDALVNLISVSELFALIYLDGNFQAKIRTV